MHLLLVSATSFELAGTKEFIESERSRLERLDMEILVSGIGMVPTAFALTKKIFGKKPGLVIQAGIGGATSQNQIGKPFVMNSDEMADLGVTENKKFKTIFDLGLAGNDDFPFSDGIFKNPNTRLLSWTSLLVCPGITVNEITTDPAKVEAYKQKYGLAVESMEGAACHYVCLMENIPFLQIRAVSNEMGERDKSKWQLKASIETLNATLIDLIQKLNVADETKLGLQSLSK